MFRVALFLAVLAFASAFSPRSVSRVQTRALVRMKYLNDKE